MFRAILCAALLPISCLAQTNAGPPRFEVAAIHPIDPVDAGASSGCPSTPRLLRCTNVTLKRCITGAYRVGPDQVLGGPDWIATDRFQITGRSEQPADDLGMMAMLQTLLADRFKLVLHREPRRREAMVLEIGDKRPNLQTAGP